VQLAIHLGSVNVKFAWYNLKRLHHCGRSLLSFTYKQYFMHNL
jgi:hypothetical protein